MRIYVAGGAGAIGKQLVPLLVGRKHHVIATTRSASKIDLLRGLGAEAVVVDGLDAGAVGEAVARAKPDVIIHQMTALAGEPDMRHFDRWFATTNQLRTKGTEHLLAAARVTGVSRFIAQSYTGWTNARTGSTIKTEDDPLDPHPAGAQTETLAAIRALECAVLEAPLTGIVLRYGSFYGPGASEALVTLVRKRQLPIIGEGTGVWSWIHVRDAAAATVAAVDHGERGVYNVVDDEPARVADWLPYLAIAVRARPPLRIPAWVGRIVAGRVVVQLMTEGRGSSNEKAKRELRWRPSWRSWRDGFRNGLAA